MPTWCCPCYTFAYLTKGVEIKYEKDSSQVRQYIPFSMILSIRIDTDTDNKIHTLTLLLQDSLKYSYPFKTQQEAERVYDQLLQLLNQ